MGTVFVSEVIGTGLLLLLGCGVVANVILPKTKGNNSGWLVINFGWGFAVFAGVFAAVYSGAHINPAVTIGLLVNGAEDFGGAAALDVNVGNAAFYMLAQLTGAFLGAVLAWLAYKRHFDLDADPGIKLAVFSTGPEIRSTPWNLATEVIGTFVLVFVVLAFGWQGPGMDDAQNAMLGPLAVALLVVGIGASLGGPTGYAINPARDLGPRIAHAVLPIPNKGDSDWGYSWIPVVGPLVGGVLGGLAAAAYF